MTKQGIINTINSLNRVPGAFYAVTTETSPKCLKRSRVDGSPLPFQTVVCQATFSAKLACDYTRVVKRNMGKQPNTFTEAQVQAFKAQKPNGLHHTEEVGILESDKVQGQYYLALMKVGGQVKNYIVDGRPATDEEVENLRVNFFPLPSNKVVGVKEIAWRHVKVQNVVSIS